jgi:Rrf2 family protein
MISKKLKYALKALIEMVHEKNEFAVTHQIANRASIPLKFLEQIMNDLKKGRLINSKKGNTGGYYFLKDPKDITLAEIYRLIDGPIAWVPCASLHFYERCEDCPSEKQCSIHAAAIILRDQTLTLLDRITIYEMAHSKGGRLKL